MPVPVVLSVLLLATGCAGGGTNDTSGGGDARIAGDSVVGPDTRRAGDTYVVPAVELGTSLQPGCTSATTSAFEEFVDDVRIVAGPQGGYHIMGSMRVQGIDPGNRNDLTDPSNPTTEFQAWIGNTRLDKRIASYTQGLDSYPGGHEMVGRCVILDILTAPEVIGQEVRVTVSVTDARGAVLTDSHTGTAVHHPNNP